MSSASSLWIFRSVMRERLNRSSNPGCVWRRGTAHGTVPNEFTAAVQDACHLRNISITTVMEKRKDAVVDNMVKEEVWGEGWLGGGESEVRGWGGVWGVMDRVCIRVCKCGRVYQCVCVSEFSVHMFSSLERQSEINGCSVLSIWFFDLTINRPHSYLCPPWGTVAGPVRSWLETE